MQFELFPIYDSLLPIYAIPRGQERFAKYLHLLQGASKSDMETPIGGFNPMGKPAYIQKLKMLGELKVEGIIDDAAMELNQLAKNAPSNQIFRIAFNLLDDVQGSWSNRYTADYDNRFKLHPLISRDYSLVIFWASESLDEASIYKRVIEAGLRSWYFSEHQQPTPLKDHIDQEAWVAKMSNNQSGQAIDGKMTELYGRLQNSESFPEIFAFLYGDEAAISLGHPPIGVEISFGGLEFAKTRP